MSESKLEYFLGLLPDSERLLFQSRLSESRRKKDQTLGKMLSLFSKGVVDNQQVYKKLYPGKPYSDKQVRNLRSVLFGKLTDFMALRHFESSPEHKLFTVMAMNELHPKQHFSSLLEKSLEEQKAAPLSLDQADLYNRFFAQSLIHQVNTKGRKGLPLHSLIQHTEESFVARILYYALAHAEAQQMWEAESSPPPVALWSGILERLQAGDWADSILIQMYFALYKLVNEPNQPEHYLAVKDRLTQNGERFGIEEAQRMYTIARNHCIRTLNKGNQAFLTEVFHVFSEMADRNLLLNADGIAPWPFKTIVTCAVRLGRFEWASEFMEAYKGDLPPAYQENLLEYCAGMMAFHQGDYTLAERKMNKVLAEYTDPFFGLDARTYLLRVHYETGNFTSMEALMNSFRLFLKRNSQISEFRLKNYQEFIRFYRRLVVVNPNKINLIEKLYADILNSPYHAGRAWLLEKLAAYLPKRHAPK